MADYKFSATTPPLMKDFAGDVLEPFLPHYASKTNSMSESSVSFAAHAQRYSAYDA